MIKGLAIVGYEINIIHASVGSDNAAYSSSRKSIEFVFLVAYCGVSLNLENHAHTTR